MKSLPIEPAVLAYDPNGTPWSAQFADIYHSKAGAFSQAQHVFLAGNDLPKRWQLAPSQRFVILEIGLGLANNFLATWQAWRATPEPKAALDFVSLELHPFTRSDLQKAHSDTLCPELVEALLAQWPPLTHNLHTLTFENARVRLLLALGDALTWLPELPMQGQVDAFFLDGFSPPCNPTLWQPRVYKALARLAKPQATLATWSASRALREGLLSAGFEASIAPGHGSKRHMTVGRFAPRFIPRQARTTSAVTSHHPHALIIGAGLAGCATAWGLSQVGWRSTVLDAAATPATGASGNPAGLFHGIVNGQDATHARLHRSAALAIHQVVQRAMQDHALAGQAQGLWRSESSRTEVEMHALLSRLGWPATYVQAYSAASAQQRSGWAWTSPMWWFAQGGWVDPAGLCRAYLAMAAPLASFQGGQRVASLRWDASGWSALDSAGHTLSKAPALVLCNAGDVVRLLEQPSSVLSPVRGQLSWCTSHAQAAKLGWPAQGPYQPVAGSGYALKTEGPCWLWGASAHVGDLDPRVRQSDHISNLVQWARLRGCTLDEHAAQAQLEGVAVEGRVGWRWNTVDKLPLWGGVPLNPVDSLRLRYTPRVPGLWVCTGLGSRGITWSALAGQVMAALVSGTPCPLESSLLDAVDPARVLVGLPHQWHPLKT